MGNMHRKGYSLASLLLLTAVVAVFLAAICSLWRPSGTQRTNPSAFEATDLNRDLIGVCVMGGLLVGPLVGLVIGAGQVRPLRGAVVGIFAGLIAGGVTGALLAAPGKMLPIAVGSLVLVLFGAVVRRFSGRG